MISSILGDNVARTPLFGSQSFLHFGGSSVAGKTGTTNDNRDAWLMGYTSQVAVGVWTGNNDNSPMKKGSSLSGKPWRSYMDEVIKEYDNEKFKDYELPENFNQLPAVIRGQWRGQGEGVFVDMVSGNLATEFTLEENRTEFVQFNPHTILHWINKDNPEVSTISTTDPQYQNWESSVQNYTRSNFAFDYQNTQEVPEENHDFSEGGSSFEIEIKGIDNKELFDLDETQRVSVGFDDIDGIQKVEFFVNGFFFDSDTSQPFSVRFDFEEMEGLGYENSLQVVATDEYSNKVSEELVFIVRDLKGQDPEPVEEEVEELTEEEFEFTEVEPA